MLDSPRSKRWRRFKRCSIFTLPLRGGSGAKRSAGGRMGVAVLERGAVNAHKLRPPPRRASAPTLPTRGRVSLLLSLAPRGERKVEVTLLQRLLVLAQCRIVRR